MQEAVFPAFWGRSPAASPRSFRPTAPVHRGFLVHGCSSQSARHRRVCCQLNCQRGRGSTSLESTLSDTMLELASCPRDRWRGRPVARRRKLVWCASISLTPFSCVPPCGGETATRAVSQVVSKRTRPVPVRTSGALRQGSRGLSCQQHRLVPRKPFNH